MHLRISRSRYLRCEIGIFKVSRTTDSGSSPTETDARPIELAATKAFYAFEQAVEATGATVECMTVSAQLDGVKPSGITMGRGFDGGADLFSFMVTQLVGVGEGVGIDVRPLVGMAGQDE
jgi:hypothetical protein